MKHVEPTKINDTDFRSLIKVWCALYYDANRKAYFAKDEFKMRRIFNNIIARDCSIPQLFALVYCHFEWYGPSGTDAKEYGRLFSSGFMPESFIKNATSYAMYCDRTLGKRWLDQTELKSIINFWNEKLFTFPTN